MASSEGESSVERETDRGDETENDVELEEDRDARRVAPEIFTVSGEVGTYQGDSHIAMRMSAVCKGSLRNVDQSHPEIWALLPKGYDYHICAIEKPDPANPEHYKIGFRMRIKTEEEMNRWVEEYQKISYTGWRIGHGNRRSKAVRILYQKNYKCMHNIYFRNRKEKMSRKQVDHTSTWRGSQHTGCRAKLNVAIRVHIREISKRRVSRGRDVHMPDYPAMVSICHTHNHKTQSEFALRFRPVDKTVETFYTDLFKAGHSALTAFSLFQWKQWAEYGVDYEKMTLDRAYNPDIAFVYRIFYRMMRKRKPHLLKPRKVKKQGEGLASAPVTPVTSAVNVDSLNPLTTVAPSRLDTTTGTAINGRLGTDVIMEGDEGEEMPIKKMRAASGEVSPEDEEPMKQDNSIMLMDTSSIMEESGMLSTTSLLDNSTLASVAFVEMEEEADKDFFAHGFKMRVPGSNRKRKNTVNLKELFEDLEQLISKHVNETHPAHAHLARITGDRDDMIIAICTPLMRRAHTETTLGGDMCVIDGMFQSFGQVMCYVISFMVPTKAGGLPLGFLVLSSMDQVFVSQGLELFKMLLPDEAFGGRGRDGPSYFLTDEEHFKADIVQAMFPNTNVLISPYHLILMSWRWLVDPKRRIEPNHQSMLLNLVEELVSCQSAEEIQSVHLKILGSDLNDLYRDFAPFVIEAIVNRWEEWMLPADHPIHRVGVGSHPWEKVMNCLRDRVLMKGRHFNILQMTHFLLEGVDCAYERNLTEGCGSVPSDLSFTPIFFDSTITRDGIKRVSPTDFLVSSKSRQAISLLSVSSKFSVCSCIAGKSAFFCVHIAAVFNYFSLPSNAKLPFECGRDKYQIYKVATGEKFIHEHLTETMQQLSQVVEANLSILKEPIRHFIQQIERADSTSGLARALNQFTVLTKGEEEGEKERREKEWEEEMEREKKKKEEGRKKEEEEQREEEKRKKGAEEKRGTLKMKEVVEMENHKMEERTKDASWLLSQDTILFVTAPQASSQKAERRSKVAEIGRTERTPIMTPGRPVTRGVTRLVINKERDESKKTRNKSKNLAVRSTGASPERREQVEVLGEENTRDKNLILLMSEKGGMLLRGIPTKTTKLGRVLVINRPITDQQVGVIMAKEPNADEKRGKKGKS